MIEISLDSPVPLGDQLVGQLRQLIAAGTLRPGDELPPVRQLAADLGINLNTVARAYRELEASGLAVAARGRGTRVTAALENAKRGRAGAPSPATTATFEEALRRLLADAKLAGFTRDAVHAAVDRLAPHYWADSAPH